MAQNLVYFLDLGVISFNVDGNHDLGTAVLKPFDLISESWQPPSSSGPAIMTDAAPGIAGSSCLHQLSQLSNGNVVLSWTDYNAGSQSGTIKISEYTPTTDTWSISVHVFDALNSFDCPTTLSIGVDKSDQIHILFWALDDTNISPGTFSIYYFSYKGGVVVVSPTVIIAGLSNFNNAINSGGGGGKSAYDSVNDSVLTALFIPDGSGTTGTLYNIRVDTASTTPTVVVETIIALLKVFILSTPFPGYTSPQMIVDSGNYICVIIRVDETSSPNLYDVRTFTRLATGGSWTQATVSTTNFTLSYSFEPICTTSIIISNLGTAGLVPWPLDASVNAAARFNSFWISGGADPLNFDPDSANKFDTSLADPDFVLTNGQEFYGPWLENGNTHYIATRRILLTDPNSQGGHTTVLKTTDGINFSLCDDTNSPLYSTSFNHTVHAIVQTALHVKKKPPVVVSGAIMLSMGESMTDVNFPHMS